MPKNSSVYVGSHLANNLGLEVVAGHDSTIAMSRPWQRFPIGKNIGHAIIAHAAFVGLQEAVAQWRPACVMAEEPNN